MLDYLKSWFAQIHHDYGVNPVIFAIIYFAGVVPFWLSIYKIISGLKNKRFNQVRTFGIILGIVIIAPFSYVALFGHNLPFWFWIVAFLVIGYSVYSVLKKIRTAK